MALVIEMKEYKHGVSEWDIARIVAESCYCNDIEKEGGEIDFDAILYDMDMHCIIGYGQKIGTAEFNAPLEKWLHEHIKDEWALDIITMCAELNRTRPYMDMWDYIYSARFGKSGEAFKRLKALIG